MSVEPPTLTRYMKDLSTYAWTYVGRPPSTSSPHAAPGWILELRTEQELAVKTVKEAHRTLRARLDHAVALGILEHNPVKGLELSMPQD